MRDVWIYWEGKSVFLILKNKRRYSGKIIEIDISGSPIIWMILLDKFQKRIMFNVEEIETIQEEKEL